MRKRRLGLLASAVAFARSERGQRMIADARRKYDTPANRARVGQAIGNLRHRSTGGPTVRRPR
ncbi:MAG TPA: hypothetical protein VFJ17_14930 [Mycobacteriales bacterium]|jgi:hypothetical protein|nr:hypothetical protein [Mycobacteriales bacterium]